MELKEVYNARGGKRFINWSFWTLKLPSKFKDRSLFIAGGGGGDFLGLNKGKFSRSPPPGLGAKQGEI